MWLIVGAVILLLIYWKVIRPLNYWEERGIAQEKPWPIVGNLGSTVFRKHFSEITLDFYKAFPNKRYNGMYHFTQPMLLVRDLDLIKQITLKDFDYFTDHNSFVSEEAEPLIGKNLFSLKGERWRDMRTTLSPYFANSQMKVMFALLSECAQQFTQYFEKQRANVMTLEMKDVFTRYTNDAIYSVAFGLKCDSLEERNNEFYLMGKDYTNLSGLRMLKFFVFYGFPTLTKMLKLTLFPRRVKNFFQRLLQEIIQQRERERLVYPDMIQLLIDTAKERQKNNKKPVLTEDDIIAQVLLFFFGGFETTAITMSFLAYELAVTPQVQKRLQAEIDKTLYQYGGRITYEAIMELKYLDMVVSETLRKWPPGFQIDRVCVKDYEIKPVNSNESTIIVEKGMTVQIPVAAIHRDPQYYPNPDKFDPERFSDENKHKMHPYSYFPFGAGPRSCIAYRFALLNIKVLYFHLLSKFDIVTVEETPIPLKLNSKSLLLDSLDGFWLGLRSRKPHSN